MYNVQFIYVSITDKSHLDVTWVSQSLYSGPLSNPDFFLSLIAGRIRQVVLYILIRTKANCLSVETTTLVLATIVNISRGVDDVKQRNILDYTSNGNGDLLIDFLVDCGLCMLNGRIGINNFTHVSHRGRSVVDYVFVPYEQLLGVENFEVCLMSDLVEKLEMRGNSKIPDHSLLMWNVPLLNNASYGVNVPTQTQNMSSHKSPPVYKTSNIPSNFLNVEADELRINETIRKIEYNLQQENNVHEAYETFTTLLADEMERILPKRNVNERSSLSKSKCKPYWNDEL